MLLPVANASVLVNNDFHNTFNLFDLFDGLNVKDLDTEVTADNAAPKPDPVNEAAPELAVKN